MIDGLWVMKIQPPPITSGGVVLFINGKIFGGDSGFLWLGTYAAHGDVLQGRIRVHKFDPGFQSIFDVADDYEMHFSGMVHNDVILGSAMVANQPRHSLGIRLEKYSST